MVRELAAQEIVQVPPRQPREKIARKDAVLLDGRQSGESGPDVFRSWTEQARQFAAGNGGQALGGTQLCHFTDIGSPAEASDVAIDGIRKGLNDFDQAGTVTHVEVKLPQASREVGLPGREGKLGQQPERTNERGILADAKYLRFGCLGCRRGDVSSASTAAD